MRAVWRWALRCGWLALAGLAAVAWRQGVSVDAFAAGGWAGSLAALGALLVVLAPAQVARAVPAAALAVLLGGLLFTSLPELPDVPPERLLMAGSLAAAAVSALLCLGGGPRSGRALAGLIGAGFHLGLMQLLTPKAMTAPLELWPWALPALGAAWLAAVLPR